ncbi:MAG: preprotein translocase subunit SecE [Chloroflexi bacterium]|nr:preprotein translocase subunit SecE [Chloroflexota bacterium]
MSRALRRQPLVQKPPAKSPSFKPSAARPAKKQTAATVEGAKHLSFYDRRVPRPVRDIIAELKKVTWPTREETTRLTVAVVAVSITIGLLLGGVDIGFNWVVDNTLLRK